MLSDANEVVGLLTFRGDTVNGQEVSGFSFVVPSNTVMEYVKSAGASNEDGPTDKLYREGLEAYWGQHYSDAIPKFEEVKRLFPQHSEVERLLQSSQQAKAEGKDKSSFPFWLVAIVLVVLFAIILLIIIAIVMLVSAVVPLSVRTAAVGAYRAMRSAITSCWARSSAETRPLRAASASSAAGPESWRRRRAVPFSWR